MAVPGLSLLHVKSQVSPAQRQLGGLLCGPWGLQAACSSCTQLADSQAGSARLPLLALPRCCRTPWLQKYHNALAGSSAGGQGCRRGAAAAPRCRAGSSKETRTASDSREDSSEGEWEMEVGRGGGSASRPARKHFCAARLHQAAASEQGGAADEGPASSALSAL